jgi:hypothetical protein
LAVQYLFIYRKRKGTNWSPLEKKGIFVGYCEVSKAFRIYIPGHRHIEISRDVTFDEEAMHLRNREDASLKRYVKRSL